MPGTDPDGAPAPAAPGAATAPARGAAPAPAHPKSRGQARRAMRRGPTIDDVAEAAGVSRGTVSRVLNGGRYVSADALAAVHRAVRTTGYVVNRSARSLVTRRTGAVAFVVCEPQERVFEDPTFSTLLRACTQELARADVHLVFMLAGTPDERDRALRYVKAGHVDGVLLVSVHAGDPVVGELRAAGVPAVLCGEPDDPAVQVPHVTVDERGGARQVTAHLLARGCSRPATIAGPLDTAGGRGRLAGFRDVAGDLAQGRVEAAADWSVRAGERAMAALLARDPRLDAVFVASDLLAVGALGVLRRAGRRVPEDVAVGGFDDSPLACATEPRLTTVRHPLALVGGHMVRLLLGALDGEPPVNVVVPTELVVRESA